MRFTTLISAEQLQAALAAGENIVVIDTSFDLTDPEAGAAAWRAGHLPGSYHLDLERDLRGDNRHGGGRHPLPERDAFARTLGRCGVTPASQVVVLDRQGGTYAGRLWWMLRWMGHEAVALLDGGVAAWNAAGGTLVTDPPAESTTKTTATTTTPPYPERPALVETVTVDQLVAEPGQWQVVDARAAARFRGDVEPLDAAAGHIPDALNRFFLDNLEPDGRFKAPATLRAEFEAVLGDKISNRLVQQCGSGVTACHNLLAMEHAGLGGGRLYVGSWSEWSGDPARPVERG